MFGLYQCFRCRCRRRNGGQSVPCHLLHRGQHHLAGVFELEENILVAKNNKTTFKVGHVQAITLVIIPVSMSLQFAASLSRFIAAEPKKKTKKAKHCK